MTRIDIPTLLLATSMTSGMMAIVLLAASRSFPKGIQGLRHWGWGCLCMMLARLLFWLPTAPWDADVTVVLGNGLLFAGIGHWMLGTRALYGRRQRWHWFHALWLGGTALLTWFLWIAPNQNMRVALFSLAYCACHVYLFKLILRHGAAHFSTRFFALLILVQAVVTLARALIFLPQFGDGTMFGQPNSELDKIYFMLSHFMSLIEPVGFMTVATRRLQTVLEQRSNIDPLTGALNRRGFIEQYERELVGMRRSLQPIAMLSIDLDHFKLVNDRFGHAVGDQVLVKVTSIIRQAMREADYVARFGGEEFIILLPATDGDEALLVAHRVQRLLREAPAGDLPTCTVSIGVASQRTPMESPDSLLSLADAALYRAKATGRDKVEVSADATASGECRAA